MNKVTLVIRLLVDIKVVLIWHCINRNGTHLSSHADRGIYIYVSEHDIVCFMCVPFAD